ncbi:MAG: copper resistance protein B [Desulfobacterales bacterium]|nr:copper resistance protein B [Desulfobacterales bacterium]
MKFKTGSVMRGAPWFLLLLCIPALAAGQNSSASGSSQYPAGYHETAPGPPADASIRKYADDTGPEARRNFGVQPVHDNEIFAVFQADRFEYQAIEGEDLMLYDVIAWIGEDYNKLYLESEGSWLVDAEEFEEVEVELLYGRNIASFWDFQVGVRHDFEPNPERTFAAVGIQGLAPYWFEVDATAYVSEDGDVSAGLEAEYDLLLTQRLIVQPRLETALAVQEVEEYGIGQGFNDITLGLVRLRYEIRREFAPYIGVFLEAETG